MKSNYHTHTARCHHAEGTDEEYVISAIRAGFDTLGFSDHAPYPYPDGFVSPVRMTPAELDGYCESLTRLREKYKNDINILIGLEVEYFPALFSDFLSMIKGYPIEYLILGQHYLDNEMGGMPSSTPTNNTRDLAKYTEQVIAGMRTGKFSCLCHPDLINFHGDSEIYERYMRLICTEALQLGIPVEINMQGYKKEKWYPCSRFFAIAKDVGNEVIFGYDAHTPQMLEDEAMAKSCIEERGVSGMKMISTLSLRQV